MVKHPLLALCCAFIFCIVLASCNSARKKEHIDEMIPPSRNAKLADELSKNLKNAYGSTDDPVLRNFLQKLANSIAAENFAGRPDLQKIQVTILATERILAAPGLEEEIFLSSGILRLFEYENELASFLASQISMITKHQTTKRLVELSGKDIGENFFRLPTEPIVGQRDYIAAGWFEPGGLFDFGASAYLDALKEGLSLAYKAKFDPRGAVTFHERADLGALAKVLPEKERRVVLMRQEVAKLAPMKDAVVRTKEFEGLFLSKRAVKSKKRIKNATGSALNGKVREKNG